MRTTLKRPNPEAVLKRLKDFQRLTVDRVFDRFYGTKPTNRFLVADEVGLGKTLVARGVIAKTVDRLWEEVDRIDVVYICSNADIARQNIERLNVMQQDVVQATRITLLPTKLHDLDKNHVNLISMTPGTSLDPQCSMGIWQERALLYALLQDEWDFHGVAPANLFSGLVDPLSFRDSQAWYCNQNAIDLGLKAAFVKSLRNNKLRRRFESLLPSFARARKYGNIEPETRYERMALICDLRKALARTCLNALEPDLIILDEFQRFKYLLDDQNEASELAQQLFNYADHTTEVKVLMLSATPYKMCTLNCDTDDDHYRDFVETVRFLQNDGAQTEAFEATLAEYRRELFRLADHTGCGRLIRLKDQIEETLRSVMVRTERLAVSEDRNGMLREIPAKSVQVKPRDLHDYVALQRIAKAVDHPNIIEYWKSAPYLLNLMESYKFKQLFSAELDPESDTAKALQSHPDLLLKWKEIEAYDAIPSGNARLRWLLSETVDTGLWRLLWLPPALPYHQLGGPFAEPRCAGATKSLIFSSWQVVPKMIAALVSYEAERQAFHSAEESPRNTSKERERRSPLLQFARSEGRLTGMPVFTLIYPSLFLSSVVDPLHLRGAADEGLSTVEEALETIKQQLLGPLQTVLDAYAVDGARDDESWYWAAPMLLDRQQSKSKTAEWWERPRLAQVWSEGEPTSEDAQQLHSRWTEHVEQVRKVLGGQTTLGRPPADLVDVLALMALAGPGVTALRALSRLTGSALKNTPAAVRDEAARAAWCFRNLFNLPESMAIVQGAAGHTDEPYWRRVLRYCAAGGLQAVLDEYCHVLPEQSGVADHESSAKVQRVAECLREAVSIRTSPVVVDEIRVAHTDAQPQKRRMRSRFAMRFGDNRVEGEQEVTRPTQIRAAFNSPFWPFVLATTSVGQEGLDFHTYCHRVVHWNLPSNPVDLEQREGRVHRYKGHAVRKNVAQRCAPALCPSAGPDPWTEMFAAALAQRDPHVSDIVPYWVCTVDDGAVIERHVPAVPFSRDQARLTALRKSLAVYRMVFGQTRQEDLIEYLTGQFPEDELNKIVAALRIDLAPK